MAIEIVNPATGEKIKSFESHTKQQTEKMIDDCHTAFLSWRQTSFGERSKLMMAAAKVLKDKREEYAKTMVTEMGKTIVGARAEVDKCVWVCEYYAENAEKFLGEIAIEADTSKSFVTFNPLGIVLAVMPWNFPLWQVFRFAAPALMAGNVGILKHASNVPQSALNVEEVFKLAGFPENTFKALLVGSRDVAAVIENPKVKAVTLTGSTPAGKAVAKTAGSVLKKTVLELGGSDPYVILEDADIESAANACVTSRLINAGQSCIAAKRFIVVKAVKKEFEEKFVALMKSKKMGDPMDEANDLGPQARLDLRDELHAQVKKTIEQGATCLLGGEIPAQKGAYYPPTVLTNVKEGMLAYEEELFGPVATIIEAADEDEAIHIANDSIFGLGAAVFTQDKARGERIAADKIEAGACFVNSFVKSDPRLPFGGIKESGYGRELSDFGIREFVNIKTVSIA